jgi:hypothetical protein
MVNYTFVRLVFGFAALVGSNEGFVVLAPGFPVAVPNTGCVLVLGRAGADRGYTLRSCTVKYYVNGDEVQTATAVFHADGTFGTIISRLTPGTTYQVVIEIGESRAGEHETRIRSTTVIAR